MWMSSRSSLSNGWRNTKIIAFLTLDTLFWSKKTLFVLFISVLILGLSALGKIFLIYNWIRAPLTAAQILATLMSTAVIHFLVVFVSLFYGTALVSEEVEGKTLTYLFVRPIPKPTIMLGKYLALIWISVMLTFPTIVLSYITLYAGSDMRPFMEDVGALGMDLGIVFLALLAYGSLFSLIGAWLKHPILAGLIYAFGWEGIVSYLPGFTRQLTITHYIQSIYPQQDTAAAIAMLIGQRTSPIESIVTLILLTIFFLSAACLVLREKEYVLEQ
jgi:ABC-2 type transport system permease protein